MSLSIFFVYFALHNIGVVVFESMRNWLDKKFEEYEIVDGVDLWSPAYIVERDKFLTRQIGSPVSSVNRWKFYILRVERRLRYVSAKHQPFKKLAGEDLVTLHILRSTLNSLSESKISMLYTKTALISTTSSSILSSTLTVRTWIEALLQRGVIKELVDPAVTSDKRKKILYASAARRVKFYKDCVVEMLNHINGVQILFGRDSNQFTKEVELFSEYKILSEDEILLLL